MTRLDRLEQRRRALLARSDLQREHVALLGARVAQGLLPMQTVARVVQRVRARPWPVLGVAVAVGLLGWRRTAGWSLRAVALWPLLAPVLRIVRAGLALRRMGSRG